ncbi:MAG: hypothetical protein GY760_16095 [Deltaproteobacteria bacterium]|nr:hypothetical protein [Deltaproteobacteria bacterium]
MNIVIKILIISMLIPISMKAAAPTKRMLEANNKRRIEIARNVKASHGWEKSLKNHINCNSSVIKYTHLSTYKHFPPSKSLEELNITAKEFAIAISILKNLCEKNKLSLQKLTYTIYLLTNSDFEPVTCARGGGLDKLKTAKEFKIWGIALINLALLANKKGVDPYIIWNKHVMSTQVHTVEDIEKFGLNPPGQPKW